MKKFCLILAFLSFVSALPSYAMKIIVNDKNDRIVYSRSNLFDNEIKDNQYSFEKYINKNNYASIEDYAAAKQYKSQKEYTSLKKLSNEIRTELIGTTWNYDETEYVENNTAEVDGETISQYDETGYSMDYLLRNSREAADYYTRDLNHDPELLIPSGY